MKDKNLKIILETPELVTGLFRYALSSVLMYVHDISVNLFNSVAPSMSLEVYPRKNLKSGPL